MRRVYPRLLAVLLAAAWLAAAPARAGDPAFASVGGGLFDWNDNRTTGLGAVEYRDNEKFWIFKSFGGAMANGDGGGAVYAGVLVDIFLGKRFVITPNFAPALYWEGDGKDLGSVIEFRSGMEFAYRFDNRARLGVAVHHISNASINDNNPGTELLTLYFSMPLGQVRDLLP